MLPIGNGYDITKIVFRITCRMPIRFVQNAHKIWRTDQIPSHRMYFNIGVKGLYPLFWTLHFGRK